MKTRALFLSVGLSILLLSSPAFGSAYTYNVSSVRDTVTGGMMDGLEVTAYYENGTSSNAFWGYLGAQPGATSGRAYVSDGYQLFQGGNTYLSNWTLTNSSTSKLISLTIQGMGMDSNNERPRANVVFDSFYGTGTGADKRTPGSELGRFIADPLGTNPVPVTFLFSDPVAHKGTVYGDLYATLTLTFGGGGLAKYDRTTAPNNKIVFTADTDSITPVPVPATLWLLGCGILSLIGSRRKTGSSPRLNA